MKMVCGASECPARRRSESGHDGGWRLRVAAVANCEVADRFVNSASPHAAAPRSLTDLHQKPCNPGHVHRARSEVGTPGAGSPPSVPSWARDGLRARSVRCCSVAGLRLVAGTSAGLRPGHDVCVGHLARRRPEGGQDGGWRLRVAAVAYCEAADRFVNSASPCAAAPRSLAAVLCPETLQPPQAPDTGGTAAGRRRTRPGGGLPATVPTQTRGSLIECAGTYITFETFVCSLEALLDQGPGARGGDGQ
jgi:hypothetical protein